MNEDYSIIKKSVEQLLNTSNFINQLSVDCVIFGFHDGVLKVLLLKSHGIDLWSTPGGFVFNNENLNAAAGRVLFERTHLDNLYLEQFYSFGSIDRTDNNPNRQLLKNLNIEVDKDHWIYKRFVTIGYYALIDFTLSHTFPDSLNEICYWHDVNNLPKMAFDHEEIIKKGLEHLRNNLDYKIVGSNLLPEKFTMKNLQILYETILDKQFHRNNFQKKMLSLNILERHEKFFDGSANKAPYLYSFISK